MGLMFFHFLNNFVYLSLAVLGCWAQAFSGVVGRHFTAVAFLVWSMGSRSTQASVVAAHGLRVCSSWTVEYRLSSCGTQLSCSVASTRIRDQTSVSYTVGRRVVYHWATREAPSMHFRSLDLFILYDCNFVSFDEIFPFSSLHHHSYLYYVSDIF